MKNGAALIAPPSPVGEEMTPKTERAMLLGRIRQLFLDVGREDVRAMSNAQFYRYLLKKERIERTEFYARPRPKVEWLDHLLISIKRANAQRAAYASGDPNWSRA